MYSLSTIVLLAFYRSCLLFSQFYDAFGNYDVFLYPWPSAVFIAATNPSTDEFPESLSTKEPSIPLWTESLFGICFRIFMAATTSALVIFDPCRMQYRAECWHVVGSDEAGGYCKASSFVRS